ncbi:MAG: SPASM domain-containing protein [Deltaproteobacteria bacterium]|nr:SPASM domain-containing protein [Deltaproteobacteria bacterium]
MGNSKLKSTKLSNLLRKFEEFPLKIAIEPANICNANCSFCAYKYSTKRGAVIEFETYKKILEQNKDLGCRELKFTPIIGDPFLDRGLIDKIRYAKSLKWFTTIYTYTNLIGLEQSKVDDFLTSGLTSLAISTCLQNRNDFKRIYGVDKFDKVMSNIFALLESNKKHGFPINIDISLRHDKNFDLTNNQYYQKILKFTHKISVLTDNYDNWCGLIKLEDLPRGQSFRKVRNKAIPCCQLYNGFIVTSAGDIGACWVRDINLDLKIGNIYQDNLIKIWQGEKLKKLRENWLKGELPVPCKDCLQYTSALEHVLTQKYIPSVVLHK